MALESEDSHQFPPHLLSSGVERAQSKAVPQRQTCIAVRSGKYEVNKREGNNKKKKKIRCSYNVYGVLCKNVNRPCSTGSSL